MSYEDNDNISNDLKNFAHKSSSNASDKSRVAAAVLAWFLGVLGVHNFYLGRVGMGVLELILTITCIGIFVSAIIAFVEFILILCGNLKDGEGKDVVKW